MFNCRNINSGQASSYYKVDDYYSERATVPAMVGGAAREFFGLSEKFNSEEFNAALRGEFPNDNIDKAQIETDEKRAGFDCVFSAPKSLSIAALVDRDAKLNDLALRAHQAGVKAGMREVEKMVMARVTVNGKTQPVSAECVYFGFEHETARNVDGQMPDPDLHTHDIVMKSVDVTMEDGTKQIYALDNNEFFDARAQHYLDAVYKQASVEFLRANGENVILTKDGYELTRYTKAEIDAFSKRKNELDSKLEEKGLTREGSTIAQRDITNLEDRNSKKTFSREEMRDSWIETLENLRNTQTTKEKEYESSSERQNNQFGRAGHSVINGAVARAAERDRQNARANALGLHPANAVESNAPSVGRGETPAIEHGLRTLSEITVVCEERSGDMLLPSNVHLSVVGKRGEPDFYMRRNNGKTGEITPDDAIDLAIDHFLERAVFVRNRYELAEFAISASEYDFSSEQIGMAIDRAIASEKLLMGKNDKAIVFKRAQEDEIRLIDNLQSGFDSCKSISTKEHAQTCIAKMKADMTKRVIAEREKGLGRALFDNEKEQLTVTLSEKQVAMIERIATSEDRFNLIVGDAGTGKTTGMEAVKTILEEKGYKVLGMTPPRKAKEELEKAGITTQTVSHATMNPKYWDKVDDKTVIILDEAGLVDIVSMLKLQEMAAEKGARIAIVGDHKQYGSVARGTQMKQQVEAAEAAGKLVNLDKMQRGRNEFMRELHFATRDDPAKALDMLWKQREITNEKGEVIGTENMVTAIKDESDRMLAIADKYIQIDARDKESGNSYIITGKNVDRIKINEIVRSKLGLEGGEAINSFETHDVSGQEARMIQNYEVGNVIRFNQQQGEWKAHTVLKVIGKEPNSLVVEDAKGNQHYLHPRDFNVSVSIADYEEIRIAQGERVRFTQNDRDMTYINGDRGEVHRIEDGKMIVRLDRTKEEITLDLNDKESQPVRYAYCQTGHSLQGATAKLADKDGKKANVLIHMPSNDGTIDLKSFYTNVTRAADRLHVFTDATTAKEIAKLREKVSKARDKESTKDVLEGKDHDRSRESYISPKKGDKAWQRIMIPCDANNEAVTELLTKAQEQYGLDLYVHGSQATQKQIATVAGEREMEVKFDNKEMESVRKYYDELVKEGRKQSELKLQAQEQQQSEVEEKPTPAPVQEPIDQKPAETPTPEVSQAQPEPAAHETEEQVSSSPAPEPEEEEEEEKQQQR